MGGDKPPRTIDDIEFSAQSSFHRISKTLSSLHNSRLSVHARLNSIVRDAAFVAEIAQQVPEYPVLANERCGSWYIPPGRKDGSVYFKSTDGHQNQWRMSKRRLNTNLLELVAQAGGCLVVDSTRRGKTIPDALSKTVPIWCAVMNRILLPHNGSFHDVIVPKDVVGQSERAQINQCLSTFVEDIESLDLALPAINKPLKPIFIRPNHFVNLENDVKDEGVFHVLCVSASQEEQGDNDEYIQGAGDDTENWAHGLRPEIFWANKDYLLGPVGQSEAVSRIEACLSKDETQHINQDDIRLVSFHVDGHEHIYAIAAQHVLERLSQTDSGGESLATISLIVDVSEKVLPYVTSPHERDRHENQRYLQSGGRIIPVLQLAVGQGKKGSKALRKNLELVKSRIEDEFQTGRILYVCDSGCDISVGVALAMACLALLKHAQNKKDLTVDKSYVRRVLATMSQADPVIRPSRATLNSVNAFLMDGNT